jgi:hypothetical protein
MEPLSTTDVRVLGALIEKEFTTPDYYPLSLNALVHACNQSSNRDPVMQLDEAAVIGATDRLRRQSLVRALQKSDSRVMKYYHLMTEAMNLDARELGVMCVLMLRGPQTIGELKNRTGRLANFDTLADVEATLNALIARESPLAVRLPRRPGQKEVRYAQLLSGEVTFDAPDAAPVAVTPDHDRLSALEATTDELRKELADVKRQLGEFRKQCE